MLGGMVSLFFAGTFSKTSQAVKMPYEALLSSEANTVGTVSVLFGISLAKKLLYHLSTKGYHGI